MNKAVSYRGIQAYISYALLCTVYVQVVPVFLVPFEVFPFVSLPDIGKCPDSTKQAHISA